MKLLDEKGKLFGIVNVVDLAIVLAAIAIIAGVGIKVFGSRAAEMVAPKVDCYAEVAIIGAAPRIYEEVMRQDLVGERLVSGNEYLSATVEDVWLEDYVMQNPTAAGNIVDATDPTKQTIIVLVKTTVAEGTPSPKIGSQELRSGKTFIVKTQKFESSGTIRYVEFGEYDPPKGMSHIM